MKNGLWPNLFKGWDNKESETINTLKLIPVFKNFTKKEFLELEKLVHHRNFSENEFIFKNNAPGEGMYIIMKGSIKISIGDGKNEKILANLQEGDFFGELALFDDEPRSANAISLSESKLIGFFTPSCPRPGLNPTALCLVADISPCRWIDSIRIEDRNI